MAVVQLFTRERTTYESFDVLNDDYRQANRNAIAINSTFMPLDHHHQGRDDCGAVHRRRLVGDRGTLSVGTLVAFWQLLDQFFSPIEDLSDKYNLLQAAMASSERIFRILDTHARDRRFGAPRELPAARRHRLRQRVVRLRRHETGCCAT